MTIEIPTKNYVEILSVLIQSFSENDTHRRDMPRVFNIQDNEFENNRETNLDSITEEILFQIMNSEMKKMYRMN